MSFQKHPAPNLCRGARQFFGELIPSRPKVHPGHDWSRPPFFAGPGTGRAEARTPRHSEPSQRGENDDKTAIWEWLTPALYDDLGDGLYYCVTPIKQIS